MKAKNWRRQVVACLLAALVSPMLGVGLAKASAVDGTWIIRGLVVDIFDCQPLVCGQIVWIKDVSRRASQCGKTIIWGLEAKGPTEDWGGGSNPRSEQREDLPIIGDMDGTLRARIFKGIPLLGRTEILTRVDVRSLTGQC